MSPEKQRMAIAEACGFREIHYYGTEGNGPESDICPPRLVGTRSKWGVGKWGVIRSIPKYVDDLNAMDKALADLTLDQRRWFCNYLRQICGNDGAIFATAAERAEAFLRVVGKWQDTP